MGMSRIDKQELKKVNDRLKGMDIDPATGLSTKGHDARAHRRSIRFATIDPVEIEEMIPVHGVGGSICLCQEGVCCQNLAEDFEPSLCMSAEDFDPDLRTKGDD
jgi:hypothetical protein